LSVCGKAAAETFRVTDTSLVTVVGLADVLLTAVALLLPLLLAARLTEDAADVEAPFPFTDTPFLTVAVDALPFGGFLAAKSDMRCGRNCLASRSKKKEHQANAI
jgi:hypothetical protein